MSRVILWFIDLGTIAIITYNLQQDITTHDPMFFWMQQQTVICNKMYEHVISSYHVGKPDDSDNHSNTNLHVIWDVGDVGILHGFFKRKNMVLQGAVEACPT